MEQTLFEKYGGFLIFHDITKGFYQKVLDSEQVNHHFAHANIDALIDHQARFLSKVLGGPADRYEEVDLKKAHAKFSITNADYQEVSELLEESLEDANIASEDIASIMLLVTSFADQIINVK